MDSVTSQQDKAILKEQIALLYDAIPLSVIASIINAAIVAAVLWDTVPPDHAFNWLICMLLILTYRLALRIAYKNINPDTTTHNWGLHFTLTSFLTGCAWGAASIWLFPEDAISYQAFLAFVIAGMSAGASTSLSYLRLPISAFLIMAILPLAIRFFMEGGIIAYAMCTMTMLFGVIVFFNSLRIYENTLQNITLRLEAIQREKALRSSEARYQNLFDAAPLGIIYYDISGNIISCNQSFYRLFGIDEHILDNQSLFNIIKSDKLKKSITGSLCNINSSFKGTASDFLGNKDTDIRVYCNRIKDIEGNAIGGMSIVEDISEDRRIEKMKDEFISVISHELRTPLTSVRGAIKLMQGTMYDSLDDKAKELIDISGRNSELLLSLINDILDADRIESGKIDIHFDYIDIVAVIKDAVADMATYLPNKNLSYQLDLNKEHTIVRMDKNRIKQVMYNLLSNAAKFSHESSTILIQLRENADDVVISISNSGDPIPDKFTSLMFHRFSQADNTSARMASGSGLGLYITKSIIDLHNGEIGYESIENKTTFWFTLPKADQDALSNS